ncbi:MAG TPA: hypothetical protein VJZ75_01410 [Candidatus Bathyarchaeia archaeon]|nr:hypothetical protein [Candidatus Bathyarchaeia archaeon]
MEDVILLRIVKLIIVLLGTVLIYLGVKSYRRSRSKDMIFLTLGFALITAGSVAAGILFEFLGFQLVDVEIIESIMVVIGFMALIYSIYGFD